MCMGFPASLIAGPLHLQLVGKHYWRRDTTGRWRSAARAAVTDGSVARFPGNQIMWGGAAHRARAAGEEPKLVPGVKRSRAPSDESTPTTIQTCSLYSMKSVFILYCIQLTSLYLISRVYFYKYKYITLYMSNAL